MSPFMDLTPEEFRAAYLMPKVRAISPAQPPSLLT